MDPVDPIVARLDTALRGAGLDGLAPQTDAAAPQEVARAISPYALPADLNAFWARTSFASLRAHSLPRPLDPRDALAVYRSTLGSVDYGPPLLFPIAAEDGSRSSIELKSAARDGGTIFSHGGDLFRAEYPTFTDLLEVCAELLEKGRFMAAPDGKSAWLLPADENERRDARFDAARANPYRHARDVGRATWDWPEHWLVSAGFDLREREPVGATHTVAELVDAARMGAVRGRIAGRVTRLVVMDEDVRAVVDDGTGTLDVWCPAGTSPWGPVFDRRYEFEVTVERSATAPASLADDHRDVQQHASAGRLGDVQQAAMRLAAGIAADRPAAVASDVRPLD